MFGEAPLALALALGRRSSEIQFLLTRGQERLYVHTCDIWMPYRLPDGSGGFGANSHRRLYAGVPCRYQFTPNVDDPVEAVGQAKRTTILTDDIIHLPLYYRTLGGPKMPLALKSAYHFVNRTDSEDAQLNRGQVHTALGAARILPGVNKQELMAMIEEHPLQVICDFYGDIPGDEQAL